MKINLLIITVISLLFAACTSGRFISPTSSVSVEEAYKMTKEKVLLIDVREKEEVAEAAYQVKKVSIFR